MMSLRRKDCALAIAFCLLAVKPLGAVGPTVRPADAQVIQGLWHGTWGGGEANGVVFQPVVAELLIRGDRAEYAGFPQAGSFSGSVQFDTHAKQMRITPRAESGKEASPNAIEFVYDVKGDALTLTDRGKRIITLQRFPVTQNPMANVQVDFVAATGIDQHGDLLITEFAELKVGRDGATYFEPQSRALKTKQAKILRVRESKIEEISINEARLLIRQSVPVAVSYRQDDRPPRQPSHALWKDLGSPAPDNESVVQTFSRILRPGTLVFVLSARENVPQP